MTPSRSRLSTCAWIRTTNFTDFDRSLEPPRRKWPVWVWLLIIIGGGGLLMSFTCCVGLIYLGTVSPKLGVVPGNSVREEHLDTINELGLLDEGESIQLFYSDAVVDIRDGMYFLTDGKVVVYNRSLAEPTTIVPIERITDMDVTYDDSFWNDSQIQLTLDDGEEVWFPVSSDGGGDQRFYEKLETLWKQRTAADQ